MQVFCKKAITWGIKNDVVKLPGVSLGQRYYIKESLRHLLTPGPSLLRKEGSVHLDNIIYNFLKPSFRAAKRGWTSEAKSG